MTTPQHLSPPPQPAPLAEGIVAGLIFGLLWLGGIGSLVAVFAGHFALQDIRKNPAIRGEGLAVANLVVGYIGLATTGLFVLVLAASA